MTFDDVRFNALRNAHYHKARLRVLDGLNKFFNFIIIMLGAGVASEAIKAAEHHERAVYLGLATTLVATLQLVFDPGGRARTHEFLQRRFYEVLAELEEDGTTDPAKLRRWEASLVRIYADQPPTMRALDSVAYNETGDALGMEPEDRLRISFWQSLLRHVYAFNSTFSPTEVEWKARKDSKRSRFRFLFD